MSRPKQGFVGSIDPFVTARTRYGLWPTTVWQYNDADEIDRKLKSKLGDLGLTRSAAGAVQSYKSTVGPNTQGTTTSIYPPRLAADILALYASEVRKVYDPFAGGGCRAIMAAKAGLLYIGVELREEEVKNIRRLAIRHGVGEVVRIIHADAREPGLLPQESFDFCYTCPPYWNLEQYKGGKGDLSMMSYPNFLSGISEVVDQCHRVLKRGSWLAMIVGESSARRGTVDEITELVSLAGFSVELAKTRAVPVQRRLHPSIKKEHVIVGRSG